MGQLRVVLREEDGLQRESMQIWVKGMPWWSEAIYRVSGHWEKTARLTSVDGVDLPETTPRVWAPTIRDNKLGIETNAPLLVVEDTSTNTVPTVSNSAESATESE